MENLKDIYELYDFEEELYGDKYGTIYKCKDKESSVYFSIKVIDKDKYFYGLNDIEKNKKLNNLKNNINKMKSYKNSEFILKIYNFNETENNIYIIMELIQESLQSKMNKYKNNIKLNDIISIFYGINKMLEDLYKNKIICNFLNPDNILLKINKLDERTFISKIYFEDDTIKEYTAPEVIKNTNQNFKVNLWSIGVILYKLIFNEFPNINEKNANLLNLKKTGNFELDDLLKKLLIKNVTKRICYNEYINHKFWDLNFTELYIREFKNEFKINEENEEVIIKFSDNKKLIPLKKIQFKNLRILSISGDPSTRNELDNIENFQNSNFKNLISLYLNHNQISNINPLSKCSLENLITLNLNDNQISNLEPLSRCKFPLLENLILSNNKIISLENLHQCHFTLLTYLSLSNNLIKFIEPLTKCFFPTLYELHLDLNDIQDFNIINKCEFTTLKIIKINESLKNKYNNLIISSFQNLNVKEFNEN